MRRLVGVFAVIGIAVPLTVLGVDWIADRGYWPSWITWIWPSSLMLIGTAGRLEAGGLLIIIISIAMNAVLYAGLAGVLGYLALGRKRDSV